MSGGQFGGEDVLRLLAEVADGDGALLPDRICDWLVEHVHGARGAGVATTRET